MTRERSRVRRGLSESMTLRATTMMSTFVSGGRANTRERTRRRLDSSLHGSARGEERGEPLHPGWISGATYVLSAQRRSATPFRRASKSCHTIQPNRVHSRAVVRGSTVRLPEPRLPQSAPGRRSVLSATHRATPPRSSGTLAGPCTPRGFAVSCWLRLDGVSRGCRGVSPCCERSPVRRALVSILPKPRFARLFTLPR